MPRKKREEDDKRTRLMGLLGGITGITALAGLRMQESDIYLRRIFKTVRVLVDGMTKSRKRYIQHYEDPAEPNRSMYEAALEMGYPEDHVFMRLHDKDFVLKTIEEAKIQAIVVVSYGWPLEEEILEAVDGNVFILHPCRALLPDAKVIPPRDRGAAVVENAVQSGTSRQPMQIAMIRAAVVEDRDDPTSWDKGKIEARSPIFPGPTFSSRQKGDEHLSLRVRMTQDWISPMYVPVLYQMARVLGYEPQDLLDLNIPKNRVRQLFGYKPEVLRDAGLLKEEKEKKKRKK